MIQNKNIIKSNIMLYKLYVFSRWFIAMWWAVNCFISIRYLYHHKNYLLFSNKINILIQTNNNIEYR